MNTDFCAWFCRRTAQWMARFSMTSPGDRVAVAFSGGADSTVLLHCLLALQDTLGIRVEAIHVDHGLRGEASRRDAAFAADICRQLGVPFTLYAADSPGPETGQEEWARQLRYGFFEQHIRRTGCRVATAHTADDQAETLLFRLARGASVRGASGILPVREGFVRPLLWAERSQIEEYCRRAGLSFVTDETNLSPRYARNRLRSQALPALRSANAGAVRNMAAWCEELRQLEEYLAAQADTLLTQARRGQGWQASVLLAAPQPVGDRALAALCASRAQPDREKIAWLRQLAAGKLRAVQLGKNARLARSHGLLVWESEVSVPAQEPVIPLSTGIFALNEEYSVKIWCETYENGTNFLQVHKKALNYCADCDKIPSDTVLRVMQPGDRFRPRGRGVSKPLRKFYWEQGIPAAQRPFLPVLASGSRVLWVWGYGFADGLSGASAARRLWAGPHVTQEQEDNHECECEYGAGCPAHAVE